MFLALLASASALASLSNVSIAPSGSVIITPENVEMDGAGTFEFEPDQSAFAVHPPAGSKGLSLTVRLWFNAIGKPVSCEPKSSSLKIAASIGCVQLMASARFHLMPGMSMPLNRGFIDVVFHFFKDTSGRTSERKLFAQPQPAYTNILLYYPLDATPDDQKLNFLDGSLSIIITAEDYPAIAMRYGLESHSAALLGISRDGSVKSCRPVNGAGTRTAFLDNYSCALFLRRGRFQFLPNAPNYEGQRYITKLLRWALPY